jgi:ABC-type transport system substrate-binding protein/class 3 adenylate cyclase
MGVTAGERRVVSVLVADVAGSTTIAERLGPERSKYLFDEVVRLMREEVERFGGTVAQLTGDGVLALFGVPIAHEDDPERAVRASLAIHQSLARYAAEVGPAYEIELTARVAVNTGPVVVPEREASPDLLYNALGDTVNVAARLQTHAGATGVAVGHETARHVEPGFELESLGELALKGKEAPIEAFRVGGERAEPIRTELTPLVGREVELATLERVLDELLEGRGAIVVLTGEPGIGKSRLKSEVREGFRDRIRFLEGHAVAYAEEIPYWPLRELLRDWLGLGVSDPEARARLELRAALAATLGAEADDAYPFVANVLSLPLERELGERVRELSRDSVQQQIFDAVRRLAAALAREQPLCLVFEDLQWADEATLALLEDLFRSCEEEPIALVFSYRSDEEHGAWDMADRARRRYRHRFHELELAPLSREAARELAFEAARAELPDAVAAVLGERSGGNPFFLEEALRDLVERGVLRRRNGALELTNGTDVAVPRLVQETLQARLDRLDSGAREVISVASVIGRSFGVPLLERVVAREGLRPALSELERLDLVVEERRRPAPEYRFRHGLVQEVAYERLVDARRRDLHRLVGEALEGLHHDAPEEVYGLLARHFSAAEDPARAVTYLLRAGDAARRMNANREAIDHYQRALRFLRETGDTAQTRSTLLSIALTHHLAFDHERAAEAYAEAFALASPPPSRREPTERVEVGWGRVRERLIPGFVYTPQTWELVRHLYRGLLAVGREFEVQPDLAERFDVSPDGLEYRFQLRRDARWTDGAPVTAADFVATWEQMRREGADTAFLLEIVESASALDEATLELRLREPRNYFLHLVAQPPFFAWPRHLEEQGAGWRDAVPRVGNGPFVLTSLDDVHAVLVANPQWYGSRGNIREVDAVWSEGYELLRDAWVRGRFAAVPDFGIRLVEADIPDTVVDEAPGLGTGYLGFHADRPPFHDRRVRMAFAHAVDRSVLQDERVNEPAGRGGFVPPMMPGHSHRVAPEYDPDAARRLLAEAGYDNPRSLGPIEIAVMRAPLLPTVEGPTEWVVGQLTAFGVEVNVTRLTYEAMPRAIAEFAQAWVWGFMADFPDPVGLLEPLLGLVGPLYRDAEIEALLDRARSLPSQDERLHACRELERRWIGEQAALVPLEYFRSLLLRRPWLKRLWTHGLGGSMFAEAVVEPELRP